MLSHLNLFPRKKHKPYLNMLHKKLVIILKLENGFLIKVFFMPFFFFLREVDLLKMQNGYGG